MTFAGAERGVVGRRLGCSAFVAQSAIVGEEDDHGAVRNAGLVDGIHHLSDAFVEALHHCRIHRVVAALRLRLVTGHIGVTRRERDVHGVMSKVEEEGVGFVSVDEISRCIGQLRSKELPWAGLQTREFERAEVRLGTWRRAPRVVASDIDVEALVHGPELLPAQMPFADGGAPVSHGLEPFRGCCLRELQFSRCTWRDDGSLIVGGPSGDPVSDAGTHRVLAGQNACASRRADGAGGVGIGEPGALRSQPVDVRRLEEAIPVTADILPAEIVGQDENHIRPPPGSLQCGSRAGEGSDE